MCQKQTIPHKDGVPRTELNSVIMTYRCVNRWSEFGWLGSGECAAFRGSMCLRVGAGRRRYNCVCFFALFVAFFVHNVSATVSYDRKELLDIMTAITHTVLEEIFYFNESDGKDLLQTPDKALIPVISRRKRWRHRGRRSRCLIRIRHWEGDL